MDNLKSRAARLALFGSLFFCASGALAQGICTPVVYAFRHAEDTNPPSHNPIFTLTPIGKRHADLYPVMVPFFGADSDNNFCPLGKVYAVTTKDKVNCTTNCASATNAFFTGKPLAEAIMNKNPPLTAAGGIELYEYVGNSNDEPETPANPGKPNYDTNVAVALRAELLATANNLQSSAIFWTSQGLHVLGGAIIKADSKVPKKTKDYSPPRNLVYVFKAQLGSLPFQPFMFTSFADIEKKDLYVQCYNHVETTNQFNPPGPRFFDSGYYCGNANQSNLGGAPGKCEEGEPCGSSIPNDKVLNAKGKICKTTGLPEKGPEIYGRCN